MPKPVRLNIPIEAILKRLKGQSILSTSPEVSNRFGAAMETTGIPPSLRELASKRYMEPQTPTGGASLTPLPMRNPFAIPPEIEMLQNRNILPQPGGIQGELFNPTQVITPPEEPIRGLAEKIKGKEKGTKVEKPSKEQLKALIERVLNRQVSPPERLGGQEREQAMKMIIEQGAPSSTLGMTNLRDMGRTPVTGAPMPEVAVPGGRALRMPVEEARVLALQNPERFEPGGMTNFMFNPMKETFDVPPGSPEDIIGGIGLRQIKYEPLWTAPMKQAMEHLGKAEKEASGYALPKPANVTISIAQGFKIYNNILKKGSSLGRVWDEIYQKALDTKPQLVAGMDPKEYFVETYSKMVMNRGRWQKSFPEEFRFIGGLGEQMRKLIAPEAQLAERVKTKMSIPEEGQKTSFQEQPVEKVGRELTGPGVESVGRRNELERSMQSKAFKKFFDQILRESNKKGQKLTPQMVKAKWADFLNNFQKDIKSVKGLPPIALAGIGGAYGVGD